MPIPTDPQTGKATAIQLFNFRAVQMRTFHMTWFAFFLCFFAWFGIAPFMPLIRQEMDLRPDQVGNLIIGSVAMTIVGRFIVGWACDRFGPRRTYSCLLIAGSLPVMAVGLAQNYEQLLVARILIGGIGASFVITQYHTSRMFASNCVGTANATSAGWGNLGGGAANMVMPLLLAAITWFGASQAAGWRIAMLIAGIICLLTGVAYFLITQDGPLGNDERQALASADKGSGAERVGFATVLRDYRVLILFGVYAGCFGIELTLCNIAATYYHDQFHLSLEAAGLIAGLFGLMNLFARTMGGFFGDRLGRRWGLRGRVRWLGIAVIGEAIALACFSQMSILPMAIGAMIVFSLFVQMSEGATYSVVPFINRRGMGLVTGIVGAGGNAGAVAAGFLFKGQLAPQTALLIMSCVVLCCGFLVFGIRFNRAAESQARNELITAALNRDQPAVAA